MSLYDYLIGQQSWKDHVNNRDLGRHFESALTKSTSGLALRLDIREHQRAMTQGLGSISDNFAGAVSDLRYEIGNVSAGIDHLRADFNLMMGDVVWKLELQGDTLSDMLRSLRAPLDTAARELRARAEDAYRNGWYEEALGDFVQSEGKNYQDFSVHRSIGNICLYHLVDLPKAAEYFAKAAKYARPRDLRQAAEAELFVGITCGLQQNHEEGLNHFGEAIKLNPALSEAHYMHASFAGLLEQAATATTSLEAAISSDPRYYPRSIDDPCFNKVRESVRRLLDGLEQRQKALATQSLEHLRKVIDAAREFGIDKSLSVNDARRGHELIAEISTKGSYVDRAAAVRCSPDLAKAVLETVQQALTERIRALQSEIEKRKATLRKEIQIEQGELSSAKEKYSERAQVEGWFWLTLGFVLVLLGIWVGQVAVALGIITSLVGSAFFFAGWASLAQKIKLTKKYHRLNPRSLIFSPTSIRSMMRT